MMRLIFIAFVFILASCGSNSAIRKQLSGSDSLLINFNTPQFITIEKSMITTDRKAIKKLIRITDGKAGEAYKCGYDGNLMFYKRGALMGDISFNYSGDGCRHFIMLINEKLISTKMSNEAADFLKSLREGKGVVLISLRI